MGNFLSSIFGGGQTVTNPYASSEQNAASSLGGVANQYGAFGQSALNNYNAYNGQYGQAVKNEANLLSSNPYTDSYSTGQIANATNTTTNAYQSAKANLQADLARRGISGGSAETGGLAGIDAARAGAISGAANNVSQQAIQQHYANTAALTGLYGGAMGNAQGGYLGALGGQAGAYGNQASIYGNLGNQSIQMQQDNNAQSDQLLGLLSGGIGAAASLYGKAATGGTAPATGVKS